MNKKFKDMKTKTTLRNALLISSSSFNLIVKSVILSVLILTSTQLPVQSQIAQGTKHSWWFGIATAANVNFYRGSTQELNSVIISPVAFHNGTGVGLDFALLVEFHRPGSKLGIMMQAGYDNRSGTFEEKIAPCGCAADLSTKLSYITIEPSLRFTPFKFNFYLYGGPRFAFNLNKSFSYILNVNSDILNQKSPIELNGNFDNMNKAIISMQIGAGYDISIVSKNKPTQYVLSPFVSFQPYFGQLPRLIETWNITTLRVGAALKLSQHKLKLDIRKRHRN
jgi:hypothetical protein